MASTFTPKKVYDIPPRFGESPKLYKGCGTGFVVINPETHEVVSLGYGSPDEPLEKQNINWGANLDDDFQRGEILKEDNQGVYLSCDFACYQAICA